MLHFLRVIILFMMVFNMRVPYVRYTASISVIIAAIYYIFQYKAILFEYFYKKYNVIVICGLTLMSVCSYIIPSFYNTFDYSYLDGFIVQLFLLLCLIFVLPFIMDGTDNNQFEYVCRIILYTYALQGLIQFSGYVYAPLGDYLISSKPDWIRDRVEEGNRFRGLALTGSPFFELPVGMGFAFIVFFRLRITKVIRSKIADFSEYIAFVFVFIGAMFSGRTAFVGLGVGIILFIIFKSSAYMKFISYSRICILALMLLLANQLLGSTRILKQLADEVFPFAFELAYNYEEEGEFSSASTNALSEMYVLPPFDTLLFGDGYYTNPGGGYYAGNDAGYMRQIFFGGVLFLLGLVFYQLTFISKPMRIALSKDDDSGINDWFFFFFLFAYILVVNYKGEVIGRMQQVEIMFLLLGNGYLKTYYFDKNE